MKLRLEIFPGKRKGSGYVRIRWGNGLKASVTEGYSRYRDAKRAAGALATVAREGVEVVEVEK